MKSILFIILLVGWVVWGFRWMIGKKPALRTELMPRRPRPRSGAQQDTKEKKKTPDQPSR